MLNVLHTIAGIWEHTGGPAESVPKLCFSLVKAGNKITLATLEGPLSKSTLDSRDAGVDLITFPKLPGQFSPAMAKALPVLCREVDLVHGHGLWLHPNWATGKYAKKTKKPLIIAPRGSLVPKRLENSFFKKKLAAILFDNKYLNYASCLHATSEMEYESIRDYGLKNPVAIIPNGVDIPSAINASSFKQNHPELKDKKILLFLSRLSWEKGLPLLADAWESLYREFGDWHLVIAGQGKPDYEREIKALYKSRKLTKNVTWTGLLKGDEKWEAMAAADLFVLPTHSENFGIAIAEALSARVPVITTQGAPWKELVDESCGWWVPIDVDSLTEAIQEAMALTDDERKKMGVKGKELVINKYAWPQITEQMASVYKWVLNGGSTPDCVRLD